MSFVKKYKIKTTFIIIIIFLLVISGLLLWMTISTALPIIDYELYNKCSGILYESVRATVKSLDTTDIITSEKDVSGAITMINVNDAAVNGITVRLNEEIIKRLQSLNEISVKLPLKKILSFGLCSADGGEISISIIVHPFSSIEYKSSFSQNGINQTLYSLYADASFKVTSIVGFLQKNTDIGMRTSVCDVIIVGRVPETYANLLQNSDFLNLVP